MKAREVLDRLTELGHDYSTDKQLFKASIANARVTVYAATTHAPVEIRACDIEGYVARGFLVELPQPEPKKKGVARKK